MSNPNHVPTIGVALSGRASWQLIGRDGRVRLEGEQSNLILDQGLDNVFTYGFRDDGGTYAPGLRVYAAVGTSSVEPATTDTALGSELARTNLTGGVGSTLTRVANGVYEQVVTREFDFAEANGNLTEWGFSPEVTGAISIRELFRDELGDPITVTKTSSDKLRITHTLRSTLSPVTVTPHVITMTGDVGNLNGDVVLNFKHDGDRNCDFYGVSYLCHADPWPGAGNFFSKRLTCVTLYETATGQSYTTDLDDAGSGRPDFGDHMLLTKGAYTGGTYERTWSCKAETSQANDVFYGLALMQAPNDSDDYAFYTFACDVADQFTKENTYELEFTGFKVAISRAAAGS